MIHHEDRDGIAVLRMEHGKVNALDVDLMRDIGAAMEKAEAAGARAVVLTGSGSAFCAGVNLFKVLEGGEAYLNEFLPSLSGGLRRFFAYPLPVVAAVNGHAIAGGCVVAATADQVVMAAGTGRIGVTELLVGVPFPVAPFEVMRFRLPPQSLQRLVLTGQTLLPAEALAAGLVDEVVEPERLLQRAVEIAAGLASVPRASFAFTKRQLRADAIARMEQGGAEPDMNQLWRSPEIHRNIRGFLERTVGRK